MVRLSPPSGDAQDYRPWPCRAGRWDRDRQEPGAGRDTIRPTRSCRAAGRDRGLLRDADGGPLGIGLAGTALDYAQPTAWHWGRHFPPAVKQRYRVAVDG